MPFIRIGSSLWAMSFILARTDSAAMMVPRKATGAKDWMVMLLPFLLGTTLTAGVALMSPRSLSRADIERITNLTDRVASLEGEVQGLRTTTQKLVDGQTQATRDISNIARAVSVAANPVPAQ